MGEAETGKLKAETSASSCFALHTSPIAHRPFSRVPGWSGGRVRPITGNWALLTAICLLLLSACRVNYSFGGGTFHPDAKTLSVQLFDPRAPLSSPRTAQVFTETVRDLMQAQTPLALVQNEGDYDYEGAIIGYDVQPVAIQSNETAAQNRLTMTVLVRFTCKLDEKQNTEVTLSRFVDYQSTNDLSSVEEQLVRNISAQLAQDIFDRTLGSW
jgi:hypothetical protein